MSSNTITSITAASVFLTRPFLFHGFKPTVVSAMTTFLQKFIAVSGGESQTLKFRSALLPSLSEIVASCNEDTIALIKAYFGNVPCVNVASTNLAVPIPLALACHFFGFVWNDLFLALGGSEFKLVLKPGCVYVVKKTDGCIGVVWTNMKLATGIIRPSVVSRPISPSLSSPVDTYDSEDTASDTSRPSSRSSTHSTFSSRSSASSQTSIGSFDNQFKPKPSFPRDTPAQTFFTRTVKRPAFAPSTNHTTGSSKAVPTKYMYQGGVSTVLTGGVMLGNPSQAPACKPQASPAQSLVYTPPHRADGFTKVREPAVPSVSWRRSTPVVA